jgi:hypothetical protein
MKRAVGALFMVSVGWHAQHALGQSANSPPTAQFPPAEPEPATPPSAPQTAQPNAPAVPQAQPANATATPVQAATVATPPPALPAPPPGYPAYPYPPPYYPYTYPELTPIQAPPSDSEEIFSLTISPLLLIFPIVQLTGELQVAPHVGVSVIAGYGTIDSTTIDSSSASFRFKAYEIGGRVAWYPLKKFKSLQLGGQLMYLKVDTDGPVDNNGLSGTAAGTTFGPFVGYKLVTAGGFTFLAQLGVQYLVAQAEAHDNTGASDSNQDNRFAPLLNLDVGWSF